MSKKDENRSIHSGNIEEIHDVPMSVLLKPLPSDLNENKVLSLMETMKVKINFTFFGFIIDQLIQ